MKIAHVINEHLSSLSEPSTINSSPPFKGDDLGRKLVTLAYYASINKESETPWAIAAQKEWDIPMNGGKEDDIVVIVARVDVEAG